MTTGLRKAGEFCWINILTPETERARDFFASLLGWTYADMPGMGHLIMADGKKIGGLFDVVRPDNGEVTRPQLGVMIKVDNADAICERVKSLGGTATPAWDIGDNGRMAVCHDPNGAQFDLWQPKKQPGTDVDSNALGAPSWFETLTTDTKVAAKFYTTLFGWNAEAMPSAAVPYTTFTLGDAFVGGMLAITPAMGKMPPAWVTYFTVKNAADAIAKATALGGTICMAMKEAPGVGKFAGLFSPQGVPFYVIEYSEPQ